MSNYSDCKTTPSYNLSGQSNGLYCSKHKKEGMVDVRHKTCCEEGCKTQPNFNIEGEKIGLYCSKHKKEGMVDVRHKTCCEEGCKTQPNFNIEGEKIGLYCSKHMKEGMVDVKHKTCCEEGCKTRPTYNICGETEGLYCVLHKTEGMVDVKHKLCHQEGCKTRPTYNLDGETNGLYCVLHKKEGMVDVLNKTCYEEGCRRQAIYNTFGESKALYCGKHRNDNMIAVFSKTCKSEWCLTTVRDKYDGYCLFCFINLFPDKPVSRNYKTKEYAVVEYIISEFPDLEWIADKKINGGCSMRRPDLLLDLGYQILIVEVDENHHISYDCSCENKRVMELSQDLGHRPIVFIRFNPDKYESNGENISSCWSHNKKGICVVKQSKRNEWTHRLDVLKQHINYWTSPQNMTNKTVETIELFYDEF